MQSNELTNLLELIRECREVLASGRIADGAHMARLAEAELAELMGLDAGSVDKRHRPPADSPRGIHACTGYSGPFRRRADAPNWQNSRH